MRFYSSVFKNSKADPVAHDDQTLVSFELEEQRFIAFNGGPKFTFSPAVSFFVSCQTQDEVDELWEKLSEGGELSWQIVPSILGDLLNDDDDETSGRVMEAMLQMKKVDIALLKEAADASNRADAWVRHETVGSVFVFDESRASGEDSMQ